MRVSSAAWLLPLLALLPTGCNRGSSLQAAPGNPQVQSFLDFGLVPVGTMVSKPLPLLNLGPGPLAVSGVTLDGDPTFGASISSSTLQPGQSLTLLVGFQPETPGRKTATVTFQNDSASEMAALVELTGTAYAYDIPDGAPPDAGPTDAGDQPPPDSGVPLADAGPDAGTSFYEASPWPKWHHDNANTGRSDVDTSGNVGQVRFTIAIGQPISPFADLNATYLMSPVIGIDPDGGNDVIYQLGYGWNGEDGPATFIAVDGVTGQTIWSAAVTVPEALAQEGTPTLVQDHSIYLETGGEQRGQAQAFHLDPRGNILSASANQEPDGTAGDGYDTCPGFSNDGNLYLYDDDWPLLASFATTSGAPVLRFTAPADPIAHIESFSGALTDANQSVFSWGGMVLSFDGNGTPLWGGPVLLGGNRNMVVGWENDNGTGCENDAKSSPVILGHEAVVVYAGYDDTCAQVVGGLAALDLATGSIDWSFDFDPLPTPTDWRYIDAFLSSLIVGYSSPALLHDGAVVFGYLDGIYCFDSPSSGQGSPTLRWWVPSGLVLSSPAVGADDTVFIGSTDGNLYALDGRSGEIRFVVAVGSAVNSSPAIGSDGTVYFSADDGNLWGVR
jgi:outer membrane protein assembly factor BamB